MCALLGEQLLKGRLNWLRDRKSRHGEKAGDNDNTQDLEVL
jgi:hypothetical protein